MPDKKADVKPDTPSLPIPTLGRLVHYCLTVDDARDINHSIKRGEMRGNEAKEGDYLPMIIVAVWGSSPTSAVNGQLLLDGNATRWITSVSVGEVPRTYKWPTRT